MLSPLDRAVAVAKAVPDRVIIPSEVDILPKAAVEIPQPNDGAVVHDLHMVVVVLLHNIRPEEEGHEDRGNAVEEAADSWSGAAEVAQSLELRVPHLPP
jgi:hypothetical protein